MLISGAIVVLSSGLRWWGILALCLGVLYLLIFLESVGDEELFTWPSSGTLFTWFFPVAVPALPVAFLAWLVASWVSNRGERERQIRQGLEHEKQAIIAMIDRALEEEQFKR